MKPELKYIGEQITLYGIRSHILDTRLGETDTILLNPVDFDSIVLEHREEFGDSLTIPLVYLAVLLKEDLEDQVPLNRIGILQNDTESFRTQEVELGSEFYDGEVAYRCGLCGNIVDEVGNELIGAERERMIRYIETQPNPIVKHRNGKCCPNGHDS